MLEIVRGQAEYVASRVRWATGREPGGPQLTFDDLKAPDSALAREAEMACREQGQAVIGHSYRTWAFGSALAVADGVSVDPELLYVSSLLHDYGLEHPVPGEDFTLRSAARADACVKAVEGPEHVSERIGDAITLHDTPGITVADDGPLGFYVQAGAGFDLAGLRCADLPRPYVRSVHGEHPRHDVGHEIPRMVRAEAKAVPDGRFALLHRCGFNVLIRLNPVAKDARGG
jgi:hypothetical protein